MTTNRVIVNRQEISRPVKRCLSVGALDRGQAGHFAHEGKHGRGIQKRYDLGVIMRLIEIGFAVDRQAMIVEEILEIGTRALPGAKAELAALLRRDVCQVEKVCSLVEGERPF